MQAEANAAAVIKEGDPKARAADLMQSKYGQELAFLGEKTKIADGLKIHTLVMGGENGGNSNIGKVVPVLKM